MLCEQLQQALQHKCSIAVTEAVADGTSLSGLQLLELAQAAARLIPACNECQAPVAIYLTNSAAYVVAVVAATQLGLPFLPLDPSWPPCRIQQVCSAAQPSVVLWAAAASSCGGHGPPAITGFLLVELPPLAQLLRQRDSDGSATESRPRRLAGLAGSQQSKALEGREVEPAAEPLAPGLSAQRRREPAGCCYLLFTSGSIGRPLGVRGTGAGILNRCRWMQAAQPLQAGDAVSFKTAPCFVDSVWEVFGPLLAGVRVVAIPQTTVRTPDRLLQTLAEQSITHFAAVPTVWRALLAALTGMPQLSASLRLRMAVSSGEPLPAALLVQMQRRLPAGCHIWNLYGSTEVAADCTAFDCTDWKLPRCAEQQAAGVSYSSGGVDQRAAAAEVPVGSPISGALVLVLASDDGEADDTASWSKAASAAASAAAEEREVLRLLPINCVGQVAVGGAGLADGYLPSHPAATAADQRRFVPMTAALAQQAQQAGMAVAAGSSVLAECWRPGAPLFLTGDLGWLDSDGCLHLAGRKDLHVKLGGIRVDLTEVEAALAQHPAVAAAAAWVWHLQAGPVLLAYAQLLPSRPGTADNNAAADNQRSLSAHELRQWCMHRLPAAAVPQQVAVLAQLPRSAGGKVQRSELPHPSSLAAGSLLLPPPGSMAAPILAVEAEAAPREVAAAVAGKSSGEPAPTKRRRTLKGPAAAPSQPASAAAHAQHVTELTVSRAFAAALGHADFEATSNLFALGGDSLTAAQIAGQVTGGWVEAVIQHPSVRSLTAFLNSSAAQRQEGQAAAGAATPAAAASPPAQAAAGALQTRPLVPGGGPEQGQGGQQPAAGFLRLQWRAKMLQCVDAAPVLETASAAAAQGVQPRQMCQRRRVFACSHGGDVCCFEVSSGDRLWQTVLPDRTDAGMVLCSSSPGPAQQMGGASRGAPASEASLPLFLAVATNSGQLCFLHTSDGGVVGSVVAGRGIRSPPACDPWQGLVWQPTHSRQLVVAAPPAQLVAVLALPAAASAPVRFSTAHSLAFVCCLDGSLVAVRARTAGAPGTGGAVELQPVWARRASAPLFAPAAVLSSGHVAVAAVDGSIACLEAGSGVVVWEMSAGGAVFSPLLTLHLPPQQQQQRQQEAGQELLLVATQDGQLEVVVASSGMQLAVLQLGSKISGMESMLWQQQRRHHLVVLVCLASGVVAALDLDYLLSSSSDNGVSGSKGLDCVLDAVQLPGEVFAAPGVAAAGSHGSIVVVGCRDDHVYLLDMLGSTRNSAVFNIKGGM